MPVDENVGYIECWNEILVPKWIRFRHILSGNGKNHSDLAYETFGFKPGERVLDVGCGFGETCLEIAGMVGPGGEVAGIDCTGEFQRIAEDERQAAGAGNVRYILGDAQYHELPESYFDAAFARFGIMFFHSAVAAMRNVHRALKPGGRFCIIVWRSLADNPCWGLAKEVVKEIIPPPEQPTMTCGPGPFSMADEETDRAMLRAAGFRQVDHFRRIDVDAFMGNTLDEAVDFQILVGPSGEIIREAGEEGQRKLPEVRAALHRAMAPYLREDGVYMPSSSWAIVASKDAG